MAPSGDLSRQPESKVVSIMDDAAMDSEFRSSALVQFPRVRFCTQAAAEDANCQSAFPTDSAEKQKQRKRSGIVAKKRKQVIEPHDDDCGDCLDSLTSHFTAGWTASSGQCAESEFDQGVEDGLHARISMCACSMPESSAANLQMVVWPATGIRFFHWTGATDRSTFVNCLVEMALQRNFALDITSYEAGAILS